MSQNILSVATSGNRTTGNQSRPAASGRCGIEESRVRVLGGRFARVSLIAGVTSALMINLDRSLKAASDYPGAAPLTTNTLVDDQLADSHPVSSGGLYPFTPSVDLPTMSTSHGDITSIGANSMTLAGSLLATTISWNGAALSNSSNDIYTHTPATLVALIDPRSASLSPAIPSNQAAATDVIPTPRVITKASPELSIGKIGGIEPLSKPATTTIGTILAFVLLLRRPRRVVRA
jgi:hypothetical protein